MFDNTHAADLVGYADPLLYGFRMGASKFVRLLVNWISISEDDTYGRTKILKQRCLQDKAPKVEIVFDGKPEYYNLCNWP